MRLQVFDGAQQTLGVVVKATKAIVAICAEKAANFLGRVTVVDRKRRNDTFSFHGLWAQTDSAKAFLRSQRSIIYLDGDSIIPREISTPQKFSPFLRRLSISPVRIILMSRPLKFFRAHGRFFLSKIFYAAITRASIEKPKRALWGSPIVHRPNDMTHRHPFFSSDAGISVKDRGFCVDRVPVARNLADRGVTAMFRNGLPPDGKRLILVVRERMIGKFLCNHREIIPLNWGGCNG